MAIQHAVKVIHTSAYIVTAVCRDCDFTSSPDSTASPLLHAQAEGHNLMVITEITSDYVGRPE